MNVQERISKLNDLLERVRRNASAPRQVSPPLAQPKLAEEPSPVLAPVPLRAAESRPTAAVATPVPTLEAIPELDVVEVDFDEEILDITDLPADELALLEADAAEASEEPERELPFLEPPASSRRPIAATMDEALASVADQVGEPEREVPLKTPPPESGRQVAMPPSAHLQQPPPPVDLSEEALGRRPSVEQLGGLVELEERSPVDLELAALPPVVPKPVSDAFEAELERSAALPPVEPVAPSTPGIEHPSEPVSEPTVSQVVSVSSVLPLSTAVAATPPEAAAVAAPPGEASGPAAPIMPESIRREVVTGAAAVFVAPAAARRPTTFRDLLDGSLSL